MIRFINKKILVEIPELKKMNRLLDLIEEGDPQKILSEKDLFPRFNQLVKYGLVVLKDEKVFLTKKGIQAKKEGVDFYIQKEELALIQSRYLKQEILVKKNKRFFKKFKTPKFIQWGFLMILLAIAFGNKFYQLNIRDKLKK